MSFCGGIEFCWIMGIKKRHYPSLLDKDELTRRRKGERSPSHWILTTSLPPTNFLAALPKYSFCLVTDY
nr:unnamed protein product [Callosobruchus chinensis]